MNFTDYGPAAYYSWWKINKHSFKNNLQLNTRSIYSTDNHESVFFTEYLEAQIPIAKKHFINIRVPFHYYKTNSETASEYQIVSPEGFEIGDIDLRFGINLWRDNFIISDKSSRKSLLYLTAEMHTAPRGRDNKQFTDVLKLLGTINYIHERTFGSHSFSGLITIGGGGWDDTAPLQNHALKQSLLFEYKRKIKNNLIGISFGETFIFGEKTNDQGILLGTSINYTSKNDFIAKFAFQNILYNEDIKGKVQQFLIELDFPIRFKKKEKKVKSFSTSSLK